MITVIYCLLEIIYKLKLNKNLKKEYKLFFFSPECYCLLLILVSLSVVLS